MVKPNLEMFLSTTFAVFFQRRWGPLAASIHNRLIHFPIQWGDPNAPRNAKSGAKVAPCLKTVGVWKDFDSTSFDTVYYFTDSNYW